MPQFYFHVTHDGPRVDDVDGVVLQDRKAAWDEATKTCGEMIREIDGSLALGSNWQMDVWDETGPQFTINFGAYDTGTESVDPAPSKLVP